MFRKHDDVLKIFQSYKKIFLVIAALLAAVFISALSSADAFFGVKKFIEKYIFHMSSMLPLIFIKYNREKIILLAKILCVGIVISNISVLVQALPRLSNEDWRFGGVLTIMSQATLLAMSLPNFLLLSIYFERRRLKIFFGFAAAIGLAATLLNGTRGAWLAVAILIPAAILLVSKNKIKSFGAILAAAAIIGGVVFMTPKFSERVASITNMQMQSNSERLLMWRSALNMFEDNPIFGVGYGQYKFAYQNIYIMPEAKERDLSHAHNNFVQMLAECGIVGLASFIFMWIYFSYFSLRGWLQRKNVACLIFFFGLWGMMLHGFTEFNFETAVNSKLFWFSLGLCLAYSRSEKIIPLKI